MENHSSATENVSLSEPLHEIEMEQHVKIPMRDGTQLDAMIWRPQQPGRYPVIVERVSYELMERCQVNAEYFARRGYVFVGQSVRGIRQSEGEYGFLLDDGWGTNRDGYDTIEWVGAQPWSNGKVGMAEGSYSGITQYLVAPTRPPHLTALFVREAAVDLHHFCYRGGAYQLALCLRAALGSLLEDILPPEMTATRARLERAIQEIDFWERHLPLKACPPLEGLPYSDTVFFGSLNHPEDGAYWWAWNVSLKYAEIDVPIFHFGAWFDLFLNDTLEAYQGIQTSGRTAHCRHSQRLLIGPWIHGPKNILRQAGELDFGPEAEFDLNRFRLRWYDHWLKGIENGVMNEPTVRVFLMGENRYQHHLSRRHPSFPFAVACCSIPVHC